MQIKNIADEDDEFQDYIGTEELQNQIIQQKINNQLQIDTKQQRQGVVTVTEEQSQSKILVKENKEIGEIENENQIQYQIAQDDNYLRYTLKNNEIKKKFQAVERKQLLVQSCSTQVQQMSQYQEQLSFSQQTKQRQKTQQFQLQTQHDTSKQSVEHPQIEEKNGWILQVKNIVQCGKDQLQNDEQEDQFGEFAEETHLQNQQIQPPQSSQPVKQETETQIQKISPASESLKFDVCSDISEDKKEQFDYDDYKVNLKEKSRVVHSSHNQNLSQTPQSIEVCEQIPKFLSLEDELANFLKNLPDYRRIITQSFINANNCQ